jgi:hypothetical protein
MLPVKERKLFVDTPHVAGMIVVGAVLILGIIGFSFRGNVTY